MATRTIPAPRFRRGTPAARENTRGPIAGDATFGLGDTVILFDTTAGARVANLPGLGTVPAGTEFEAVISAGANNATLTPAAGDTIEGGANLAVTPALHAIRLVAPPTGTNWLRIASGS